VELLLGAETDIFGFKQYKIPLMMSHWVFLVANCFSMFARPLLSRGVKCTWLHRMVATMLVTLRHYVGAQLPSLRVEYMFTSELQRQWSIALHVMTHNLSTSIAQGWVAMIWVVSKTTTSVFVLTNIVSRFMALL